MENKEKEKKITLKTAEGCKRLLAIFIALILVFSFFARLVQTNFTTVKVEQITIDSRGAELTAELYYPAGTTSKDSLPAVVVTHGGGCTYMTSRIWAQELARRGFVVLNVSAFGAGLSAQPDYDENDQGIETFDGNLTAMGMLDAKNFLSSMAFVDSTRIGMTGHSMGSRRTGYSAIMDCGYLSLNDRLINIIYNTFGVELTEEEIIRDAYELAKEKLSEEQLAHFNDLAALAAEDYSKELKAVCLIGSDGAKITPLQVVSVGGHEVERNCQVNMCLLNGDFDTGYYDYGNRDTTKLAWHTGSDEVVLESWYAIDDIKASSDIIGKLYDTSSDSNKALSDALDNKATRIIIRNNETHSANFFSNDTTSDLVKYFEQALKYNGGDLGSANARPVDASSNIWGWRAFGNIASMLSMFGMLVSLAALLLKSKKYSACVCEAPASEEAPKFNKGLYWIFAVVTVGLTFLVTYLTNKNGFRFYNPGMFLPLGRTATLSMYFLFALTIMSIVLIIPNMIIRKKQSNSLGLKELGFGMKYSAFSKSVGLGLILLVAAYGSLLVIQYLFDQDYRSWMTVFSGMKVEYWFIGLEYAIFAFPMYIIMGSAVNFTARKDIPEWLDTIITVVVNSLGIWLCCLINIVIAKTNYDGTLFSSFICSYQFCVFVPITVYLARKMYNLTKNVFVGATLNTCLIVWSMMCSLGINDLYHGQSIISNFFNI